MLAWVVAAFLGQVGWREGEAKRRGKQLLLPLFSACPGEEEGLWCRSKRHRLLIPLFFFETVHETAPFYPKRAVSFKRKWRQSMSNLKLRFQFARVFSFWSLVSDFFNQVSNWPPDFNMYAIKPLI
jgi:hypothetical protein